MGRLRLILLILFWICVGASVIGEEFTVGRLLAARKDREEDSSEDSHRLTAHPFFNKAQEQERAEKTQNPKPLEVAAKNTKQKGSQYKGQSQTESSKQLEVQWHFYFVLMIIGTLAGMKILSIQEQRVHHTKRQFGHSQIPTFDDKEQSYERSFTADH